MAPQLLPFGCFFLCTSIFLSASSGFVLPQDATRLDLTKLPLRSAYPVWNSIPIKDPSKLTPRLVLTPFLEKPNGVEEAQGLAEVKGGPFPEDIISYAGFLTVNETSNGNLFFWYFQAENDPENAPVVLWLQGGPGSSSLFGLFQELGPFTVNPDLKTLTKNPWSWHTNYHLIFIDNPVGTGFSYTDDDGYASDMPQVADNLHNGLTQFFKLFPNLQANDFYVTGESYGGKYVPSIAYKIDQVNPTAEIKINLKGLAVGNGLTDPISMINYSELVYQLGLADLATKNEMKAAEDSAKQAIAEERYLDAFQHWYTVVNDFQIESKFNNLYNFLSEKAVKIDDADFAYFVQSDEVRELIHVGDAVYSSSPKVYDTLIPRLLSSVKPWVEHLIEKYRVLYYNGQMDLICAYAYSINMYHNMTWSAKDEYDRAQRIPWYVDNDLAGYGKKGGLFHEYLVRDAGHLAPMDQPKWIFDLISRFISDTLED